VKKASTLSAFLIWLTGCLAVLKSLVGFSSKFSIQVFNDNGNEFNVFDALSP
jgi:hypothetical protein